MRGMWQILVMFSLIVGMGCSSPSPRQFDADLRPDAIPPDASPDAFMWPDAGMACYFGPTGCSLAEPFCCTVGCLDCDFTCRTKVIIGECVEQTQEAPAICSTTDGSGCSAELPYCCAYAGSGQRFCVDHVPLGNAWSCSPPVAGTPDASPL